MQQYDAEFLEFIVQEVIRRLTNAGTPITKTATMSKSPPPSTNDSGRELVLSERLITLSTLQGRLDGIAKLVVMRKSLITPAVRDELKRRNISLRKE